MSSNRINWQRKTEAVALGVRQLSVVLDLDLPPKWYLYRWEYTVKADHLVIYPYCKLASDRGCPTVRDFRSINLN